LPGGCWISTRTTFDAVSRTCSGNPHGVLVIRGWDILALTLKIRVALFGDATVRASGAQEGSTVDDLARLLVQLNRSIAGGDDSGLLSQVKLLRADSNDRIDGLTEAFDRYAENIAETNSKAFVSALSEVVRDFNAKINDQFGDNFRQLNSAVERLVSWQVQYEKQLEALIEQETRPGRA